MPLPATLRLGAVHLTVADLERSLAWWERATGMRTQSRADGRAGLGAGGEDVVVLVEQAGAPRSAGRHAGLFHVALLFDSRDELAHAARRLVERATPVSGASDHGVSEAIYLRDPDGHGIELYADRPRAQWPAPAEPGARVGMYTMPLDVEALLGSIEGEEPREHAGRGLRVGHVHLQVGELEPAVAFHRDVLGFDPTTTYPGALFLAAGDYHHHLALNVWGGAGIPPAPADDAAPLRHWTIVLDSADDVAAVRDRVEAAGAEVADAPGGFRTRDPAGIAVAVVEG